jgi:hypothetical protein
MAGFLAEGLGSLVFLQAGQYYRSRAGSDDAVSRVVIKYFSGFKVGWERLFSAVCQQLFDLLFFSSLHKLVALGVA